MARKAKKTAHRNKAVKNTTGQYTKANAEAQLKMFNKMEKKLFRSINKLEKDIRKGANNKILYRDHAEIMLTLGECNWLAKDWKAHTRHRR
jgi:hypothetical protein